MANAFPVLPLVAFMSCLWGNKKCYVNRTLERVQEKWLLGLKGSRHSKKQAHTAESRAPECPVPLGRAGEERRELLG